jgi:hypothetical protein
MRKLATCCVVIILSGILCVGSTLERMRWERHQVDIVESYTNSLPQWGCSTDVFVVYKLYGSTTTQPPVVNQCYGIMPTPQCQVKPEDGGFTISSGWCSTGTRMWTK